MTDAERFAASLRELRAAANMSQDELASRSEIARTQISLLEDGAKLPRYETILRLAGALGQSPAAFFSGIEWRPSKAATGDVDSASADHDRPGE